MVLLDNAMTGMTLNDYASYTVLMGLPMQLMMFSLSDGYLLAIEKSLNFNKEWKSS